jgi:hypothetical protein
LKAQAAEREAVGLELPDDSVKHVTVYELDLPTNTVATDAKRWRLPASRTGCGLLPIPAGAGGFGGGMEGALLVLSENWVGLKHRSAFKELRAPFPRPKGLVASKGVLPIAWVGVGGGGEADTGKGGGGGEGFVALVQSEWGDVYEVTAKAPASSSSSSSSSAAAAAAAAAQQPSLRIRALPDWLPPCAALAPLRGGKLLWAAAETGDHTLHVRKQLEAGQMQGAVGKGREAQPTKEASIGDGSEEAAKVAPVFERTAASGSAATLGEVGREGSLAGCLKLVTGPGQGVGRVAALCGRGPGSSVRVLEGGLPVVEELEAPLPFKPMGVWSLAPGGGGGGGGSTYLLLSGAQRTAVLEVGEALVEVEAEARGFVADSRTLEAGLVGQGQGQGMVQVVPSLLRYIAVGEREKGRAGKSQQQQQQQPPRVTEWRPPGRREIDKVREGEKVFVP